MTNRVVVVTGANGALGRIVSQAILKAGCGVVAIDLAPEIDGPNDYTINLPSVDLTDIKSVEIIADALNRLEGQLTGLVNIAGGFCWELIETGSISTWDNLYAVNVRSALIATKAVIPLLKSNSSIVNVGAMASLKAGMGMGAYAASKSALGRLTESLADELKHREIRVNAVLPSVIDTPANRLSMPDAQFEDWVMPSALADVILFLLSDQARAVTGALLPVTGRI